MKRPDPIDALVTDAGGNHALATVRSLGRRGLRVAAADSGRCAQASLSRYCAARAIYPSPAAGIAPFLEGLDRILEKLRPAVLMPMTERTILALATDRRRIEARVRLAPLPSPEAIGAAFDKGETLSLARRLGIPAPRTLQFDRLPDFAAIRSRISYPAVVKPRRSETVTADGRVESSGPPSYCYHAEDLERVYLEVHRRSSRPLIQEFIPGPGYGVSALCDRGAVRALFAHRRLRMIRPTGSGSSLRESVAPPPIMADATRALLRALSWHGVAMVEFKLDSRDGVPRLMEINGRFWNSLPLAVASGIDFPFLLYSLAIHGGCPESLDYRVGVKSRWLAGDVRHLMQVLRGRPAGWTDEFPSRARTLLDFVKFVDRDLHYDDLWATDPMPFLAGVAGGLLSRLPRPLAPRRQPEAREVPHA